MRKFPSIFIWLTVAVLAFISLISCETKEDYRRTDKEGGKTTKGYQVNYWLERDEIGIRFAKQAFEMYKARLESCQLSWDRSLWEPQFKKAQEVLERAYKKRFLKVEIRGPAVDLIVMIIRQDGSAVSTKKINKEKMMDNIEVVRFDVDTAFTKDTEDDWRLDGHDIEQGVHSLVVKQFEPERVIHKTKVELPPTD